MPSRNFCSSLAFCLELFSKRRALASWREWKSESRLLLSRFQNNDNSLQLSKIATTKIWLRPYTIMPKKYKKTHYQVRESSATKQRRHVSFDANEKLSTTSEMNSRVPLKKRMLKRVLSPLVLQNINEESQELASRQRKKPPTSLQAKPVSLAQENLNGTRNKSRQNSPMQLSENLPPTSLRHAQASATLHPGNLSSLSSGLRMCEPQVLCRDSSAATLIRPPVFRQNSSAFSVYSTVGPIPPELHLTTSREQQLMTGKFLHTPAPQPSLKRSYNPYDLLSTPVPFNVSAKEIPLAGKPLHDIISRSLLPRQFHPVSDTMGEARSEANRDLLRNPRKTEKPCKCRTSRCLRLYCNCFRYGLLCDERLCNCKDCHNNEAHNYPRGERNIAIKKIVGRRPDAFTNPIQRRNRMRCSCKKSG